MRDDKAIVEIYPIGKINGFNAGEIHLIGEIYFPGQPTHKRSYEIGFPSPQDELRFYTRMSYGGVKEEIRHLKEVTSPDTIGKLEECLTPTHMQEIDAARLSIIERMTQSP